MKKVKNKKTGVIKEPKTEIEVSMYLATNEWELVKEEKEEKPSFNLPKNKMNEGNEENK